MWRCLALGLLGLAGPAAAVTVTSAPGAPDPGMARGETLLVDFDAPLAVGVGQRLRGPVSIGVGSVAGMRATPAGTAGRYAAIGRGGSVTYDFTGFTGGAALSSLSFYWGSIDDHNHVDFLDAAGRRIDGISGGGLPRFDGDQTAAAANRRVFFDFLPTEKITGLRLRSAGNAFEFDSIAAAAVGGVPEVGTWAMLIIGFAGVGMTLRRRRGRIGSVLA